MASGPLKAALLIVSTTAAKDASADASGPILTQVLKDEGDGKWEIHDTKIVSDDVLAIQRQITTWTDSPDSVNLVVTTGGTGFATGDSTPEAVTPLLHKQAPGLVHGMLAASLTVTPFAMMSRPAAGVRNSSIIVTLPGSPKGAKENLQAIVKTLPHACIQAAGGNSRALHSGGIKKLEAEAGLTGGDTHSTAADSPYPMLPVEEALSLIEEHTPEPEVISAPVNQSIINSVLAEDVKARENVPAFRASIVDGYAVVAPKDGQLKGVFPVTAISHASPGEIGALNEGELARITTGAPLPPGATTVVMVEDTILKTMSEDGKEEKEVEIQVDGVKEGENIREVGSDVQQGTVILNKGETISGVGGEIGLLASVGVSEAKVYRRPVVAVLSTGDEIVEYNRPGDLKLGEVRDTNRITLMSAAREWGYEVVDLGIASDKPGTLEETLRDGFRRADLLITTGGVSMGELDLLKPTIERSLGGTIHFGRVAMKPGKPTTFATVSVKDNSGQRVTKTIFSLPGNPASALVTFHLFVLPSLHKLSGASTKGLPRVPAVISHDFPLDPRPEYHRAVVTVGKDGLLSATSTGGQRSSKVGSLRSANALVILPSGKGKLEKGSKVEVLLLSAVQAA
ncbi:MoaB/Mog domain [Fusarium oxysporum f. sp. vasinfectum]|nr:MoaB/Mog domain [Fusarium oxysporum f. sp. vasinfectum]KAK2932695.1 MoaB/Mog domain [Fusarium oxysporum f. sp. vasinfectum]